MSPRRAADGKEPRRRAKRAPKPPVELTPVDAPEPMPVEPTIPEVADAFERTSELPAVLEPTPALEPPVVAGPAADAGAPDLEPTPPQPAPAPVVWVEPDIWADDPDDLDRSQARLPIPPPMPSIASALLRVGIALALIFGGLTAGLGYWQVVEAQSLTTDPEDPLVQAAIRNAPRGTIYDANGVVVASNIRSSGGGKQRSYADIDMAPIIGYESLFVGTSGLERAYDAELSGLGSFGPGGDVLRKFRTDPYDPADLYLSVDTRLQDQAMAELGSDRGAVVAIEPSTGRILAMASTPSYDPNQMADPDNGQAYLQSLLGDDAAPLLDRATQGRYVPGSVFKIVTSIAALGSGAIRPDTTYATQPEEYRTGFKVQGFRIHDSPRDFQTDHPLDYQEAIEVSSNIYFAHVGLDTGADQLLAWSARLGFGAPIPFDLPTATSQLNGGDGPLDGFADQVELANAAYGQAETLVTPLQMALVAETVADDGVMMRPHLVDRLQSENGETRTIDPSALGQVMSGDVAEVITQAMITAVEGRYGHFYTGAAQIQGVSVAGKSGTAELDGGAAPHSWFIGFAPADHPTIAVAVIVENGGPGRSRAVPLGGDIMRLYLSLTGG